MVFFEHFHLDRRANLFFFFFFWVVLGINSGQAEVCYSLILEDFAITVGLRNRLGICCSQLSACSEQFIRALLLRREQLACLHVAFHSPLHFSDGCVACATQIGQENNITA